MSAMDTNPLHDLERQQINSLIHWVSIHNGTETQQISNALQVWMNAHSGPVNSTTAWIEVLKHAYNILYPLHDEVDNLFVQYFALAAGPSQILQLLDPIVYPQSVDRNPEIVPPPVPLFDLTVLAKESVPVLRGRVVYLVRAKWIKAGMRERLREALGVLQSVMQNE